MKDVISLYQLFETFNHSIYEMFMMNVTSFYTLSHCAYDIWRSTLRHTVELFADQE